MSRPFLYQFAFIFILLYLFHSSVGADQQPNEENSKENNVKTFSSPQQQVVLLELYTSEGCSSCPPADRWVSRWVDHPGLWQEFIPLAFHVDYWNWIGWADRFSSARYTARQQRYAKQGNVRTVYTPGFVVNGAEWRGWFSGESLALPQTTHAGQLNLELSNNQAEVHFQPDRMPTNTDLKLHIAILGFDIDTRVTAGENQGKTLSHDFVVLGLRDGKLKADHAGYSGRFKLPKTKHSTEKQALVAWVSERNNQTPIQAVGGWLVP